MKCALDKAHLLAANLLQKKRLNFQNSLELFVIILLKDEIVF